MVNLHRRSIGVDKRGIHYHDPEMLLFYQLVQYLIFTAHSVNNNPFNALCLKIIDDSHNVPVSYHGKKHGDDIQLPFLCFINRSGKILHINFVNRLGLGIQIQQQGHSARLLG